MPEKKQPIVLPFHKDVDSLDKKSLENLGLYRGMQCIHGHDIRSIKDKWCYHCAHKISINSCGFDVNYIESEYKVRFLEFLKHVELKGIEECWPCDIKTKRMTFPSYRSESSKAFSENLMVAKIMYTAAWGDIGSLRIQRKKNICTIDNCVNPLHWECVLNLNVSPKSIHPLIFDLDFAKIKHYGVLKKQKKLEAYRLTQFKNYIKHPSLVEDRTEDILD
tara:strand:+ start:254 stop:913 length:660 start_codon:yes stop_codon:yes gene_type:complete